MGVQAEAPASSVAVSESGALFLRGMSRSGNRQANPSDTTGAVQPVPSVDRSACPSRAIRPGSNVAKVHDAGSCGFLVMGASGCTVQLGYVESVKPSSVQFSSLCVCVWWSARKSVHDKRPHSQAQILHMANCVGVCNIPVLPSQPRLTSQLVLVDFADLFHRARQQRHRTPRMLRHLRRQAKHE